MYIVHGDRYCTAVFGRTVRIRNNHDQDRVSKKRQMQSMMTVVMMILVTMITMVMVLILVTMILTKICKKRVKRWIESHGRTANELLNAPVVANKPPRMVIIH